MVTLGKNAVGWIFRKQLLVANSSIYAKYITLLYSVLEARTICNYNKAFNFELNQVFLFCDNKAAQFHAETLISTKSIASRH